MFAKNNFQSQKNIILMDGRQIEEKFNKEITNLNT
jgi:hypothetical protein